MSTTPNPAATPPALSAAGKLLGGDAPRFSGEQPLTAWWAAERAAEALIAAGLTASEDAVRLLGVAQGWLELAQKLSTNAPMNRPKEDGERDRRRG